MSPVPIFQKQKDRLSCQAPQGCRTSAVLFPSVIFTLTHNHSVWWRVGVETRFAFKGTEPLPGFGMEGRKAWCGSRLEDEMSPTQAPASSLPVR